MYQKIYRLYISNAFFCGSAGIGVLMKTTFFSGSYNGLMLKIIAGSSVSRRIGITNHARRTWYDEAPSKGALVLGKPLKGLFLVYS